jgi:hypothetical protein
MNKGFCSSISRSGRGENLGRRWGRRSRATTQVGKRRRFCG